MEVKTKQGEYVSFQLILCRIVLRSSEKCRGSQAGGEADELPPGLRKPWFYHCWKLE